MPNLGKIGREAIYARADPVHDQGGHMPTLKLNKKKKKKILVGIYKFKKYKYAKVHTLIFVLNPHLCFRRKKIKKDKCIKITSNISNNLKL